VKFMASHQDRVLSGIVGGMGWLREGSAMQNFGSECRNDKGRHSIGLRATVSQARSDEAELRAINVRLK